MICVAYGPVTALIASKSMRWPDAKYARRRSKSNNSSITAV